MDAPIERDHSPATTATVPHHVSQSSSPWPSPEQQRGITALSGLSDLDIFSALSSLRLAPSQLTDQHLQALVCLRSASDDYIKTWLDHGRRFSGSIRSVRSSVNSNLSNCPSSTASWSTRSTSLSGRTSFSQPSTAIECLESVPAAQDSTAQNGVKHAVNLNKPLPPEGPLRDTAPGQETPYSAHDARHDRWCTTREHKTVFTTYRGFQKHENEHDNFYCALCETPNPSKAHLQHHNTLKYDGWLGGKVTRSRRGNFEELLKKHKASSEKIKILLNKWRAVRDKKAYSCGFCVSKFSSLPERTSHIDCEHYAKGEHVKDWNNNLVIKGLLLHGDVKQECMKLFYPLDPTAEETKIGWPLSVIEKLQLRLELGKEAAKDLAKDVFRQARIDEMLLPTQNSVVADLRPNEDTSGCIEASISTTKRPTNAERMSATSRVHLPNQGSDSSEQPLVQHHTHRNDLGPAGNSFMSTLSPAYNSQCLETSFGYPARSASVAAYTTGNTSFIYDNSDNAYDNAHMPFSCQMLQGIPSIHGSNHLVLGVSNSLEGAISDSNIGNFSSLDEMEIEAAVRTASQFNMCQDHEPQSPFDPSTIVQAPKRKFSDNSIKEANLKAQTQAPVSKYCVEESRRTAAKNGPGKTIAHSMLN